MGPVHGSNSQHRTRARKLCFFILVGQTFRVDGGILVLLNQLTFQASLGFLVGSDERQNEVHSTIKVLLLRTLESFGAV